VSLTEIIARKHAPAQIWKSQPQRSTLCESEQPKVNETTSSSRAAIRCGESHASNLQLMWIISNFGSEGILVIWETRSGLKRAPRRNLTASLCNRFPSFCGNGCRRGILQWIIRRTTLGWAPCHIVVFKHSSLIAMIAGRLRELNLKSSPRIRKFDVTVDYLRYQIAISARFFSCSLRLPLLLLSGLALGAGFAFLVRAASISFLWSAFPSPRRGKTHRTGKIWGVL